MFNEFWIIYAILLLFAFYCIVQDIESRKVSNHLTLGLFILSFGYFLFSIKKLNWIDFIILLISIIIIYYIYKKGIWGAADGKILISIMLLLTGFGTSELFLDFVINLFFIYSLGIILVILFMTNKDEKFEVLKDINYGELLFLLLFAFIILKEVSYYFPKEQNLLYILIYMILLIILMRVLYKYLKKAYMLIDENLKIVLMFTLFSISFYMYLMTFILYLILIFLIKASFDFIFKSLDYMAAHKNYKSPFTVYLFLAAIFTLVIANNMIYILVILNS